MKLTNKKIPQICTPTDNYVRHYPKIVELANRQFEKQFWTSSEMKVHLDRMHLLYELSDEQSYSVHKILNIFLRYELMVGDFWQVVAKTFPRPEVKLAASVLEAVERAVHAEFYNQINIVLSLDKEEDYLAYQNDPELLERVNWLNEVLEGEDKILATCIFSMTETALLFSLFAELKSFQTNGYNLIPVTVRGTNQSAIDEDLHGQISAEIINTYYNELGTKLIDDKVRYPKIKEAVHKVREHEHRIIDNTIIGNELNGVNKEQFKKYVDHRLNVYLERIGLPHEFVVVDCQIEDWFGKNTYAYKVADFFTPGMGMEYESSWNEVAFTSAWTNKE